MNLNLKTLFLLVLLIGMAYPVIQVWLKADPARATPYQTVRFTAYASETSPGVTITDYAWDFENDGIIDQNGLDSTVTHVYTNSINYNVVVTVTNSAGQTKQATINMIVNYPPNIVLTSPSTAKPGDVVTFDATQSSDSDGNIANYIWRFGDGTSTSGAAVRQPQHTYQGLGTYPVTLILYDDDNYKSEIVNNILINNPPVASFTVSPQNTHVNQQITFDASGSFDIGGTIVKYEWDFNNDLTIDKTTQTPVTTYSYNAVGAYATTLTVTDEYGATDTKTIGGIVVTNSPPVANAGPDKTVNLNQQVQFSSAGSSDDVGIASYLWLFDENGAQSTAANPAYTYTTLGTHTVALTVTDTLGLSATDTADILVNALPVADFSFNPQNPAHTQNIVFDASTSGDTDGQIISYNWNFGEGSETGPIPNPVIVYRYNDPGTYTVKLTVTDDRGATATLSKQITLTQNLLPTIEAGPDKYVNAGDTVAFDGTASDADGQITSYFWSFGDNAWADKEDTTHIFTGPAQYNIMFKEVVFVEGNIPAAKFEITNMLNDNTEEIIMPGIGNTYSAFGGNVMILLESMANVFDENHQMTYKATIKISQMTLPFPNNAVHMEVGETYCTAKLPYIVLFSVMDDKEGYSVDTLKVFVNEPPTASFTYNPINPKINQQVTLDASTSSDNDGTIAKYEWDFNNDGTYEESTTPSTKTIIHTFTTATTHIVTLRVTDDRNAQSKVTNTIKVKTAPGVTLTNANYTVVGANVNFVATGAGSQISFYEFDFDGNGVYDLKTSMSSITHSFQNAGKFTPKVKATDSNGETVTADGIEITVNAKPIANAGSDKNADIGGSVSFDGSGSFDNSRIASYLWDFGDGTQTATGQTVAHSYTTGGDKTVTLTVKDESNEQDSDTLIVHVNTLPVANAGPDKNVRTGDTINFDGSASTDNGVITEYLWNFGDGILGIGVTPQHSYIAAGTYTVKLSVKDDKGATTTDTATINVYAQGVNIPPVANAGPDKTVSINQNVQFNGSASDADGTIASYTWNFGDQTTGTGQNVTHAYTAAGTYTVTLTVTDNSNAAANDTAIVTVRSQNISAPNANAGSDKEAKSGETVSFFGTGSDSDGYIVSYSWNFGDQATGTGQSTTHIYTASGVYTATLTVTDNDGLNGSDTATIKVTIPIGMIKSVVANPMKTKGGKEIEVTVNASATQVKAKIGSSSSTLLYSNAKKAFYGKVTAPKDSGTYSLDIEAKNAQETEVSSLDIIVDNDAPVVVQKLPNGAVNSTNQILQITTNEEAVCKYSTITLQPFSSMTAFRVNTGLEHYTEVTAHAEGDTYYVKCQDTLGNEMANEAIVSFKYEEPKTKIIEKEPITGAFLDLGGAAAVGVGVVAALGMLALWFRKGR